MGCCATGKCINKEGGCGCTDSCTCAPTAGCRRGDVRKKPELGGGSGMLLAAAGIVVAAAAGAAAFYVKNKK
eukprot:CAMPEP_0170469416 /NCGR_PEP_ID=MMETSP0123-20130129/12254_1 /TAXON_ID=182087 /ORGANISM="Favella ehrenbergii, Strain Fehren 1" /LENGTH=71 /DNA_ID=CAMNT_0010736279 /DNA_START=67 /DNA_END=282 /DNA_ORIENTATION=-